MKLFSVKAAFSSKVIAKKQKEQGRGDEDTKIKGGLGSPNSVFGDTQKKVGHGF